MAEQHEFVTRYREAAHNRENCGHAGAQPWKGLCIEGGRGAGEG